MTVSRRPFERILNNGVLLSALVLAFILGISGYDDSFGLSESCKDHCDKHRSRGWTGSFFFNCEAEYHNDTAEKRTCQNICAECPNSVCNEAEDSNSYRCPKTQIKEECANFCDEHRPEGNLDGYVLNCKEAFNDDGQKRLCQNKCVYGECPKYMCKDGSTLFCPIGEFSKDSHTDCWNDCEKYRDALTGDRAYIFRCSTKAHSATEKTQCQENCKTCPLSVCKPKSDSDTRHCPSNFSPTPLHTTPKTTPKRHLPYDGACKRRCDKHRLGGSSAFSFSCDTIFHSSKDFSECLSDCLLCSSKICSFTGGFSPTFHCPKADNAEDSKLPPQYMSPLCVFFLVSSLLFLLCFFSGGCLLLYKRRIHFEKKRREIKKRFAKRVSFQDNKVNNLELPNEQEPSSASSASVFDLSPSVTQSESSFP